MAAIPYEKIVEEDLNFGAGTVAVTMPGGGSLTGHQIGRRSFFPYSIHYWGAVGDGVADDTSALVKAIAAAQAAGGGVVWIPNGTYRMTAAVAVTASNIQIVGESREKAILVWDDTANRGLTFDTSPTDPVSSLFTVDAVVGARTVTVADGTTFAVGNWAFLDDSGANTGTLMTRVKSISGNDITLEDAIPCDFTVANSATLFSYVAHPLLDGCAVRDLTLKCVTTAPVHMLTLLLVSRCNGARIENCHFNGSVGPLVTTRGCYRGHISENLFKNAVTVAGSGIEHQTSTGMTVARNDIDLCQFGITFASSPYCRTLGNRIHGRATTVALGRGIRYGQSSNFGVITGNNVSDTNLYGIYMQDSAFCTISDNTVSFTGDVSTNTGEHGIQLGGFENAFTHHCVISGNSIRGASGYGISINMGLAGADTFDTVVGNVVSGCYQGALFCNGSRNTIAGNTLSSAGTTVSGGILRLTFTADWNTVTGNTIANEDTHATTAINSSGGGGHNALCNNLLATSFLSNNLNAGDTVFATLADATAAAAAVRNKFPMFKTTAVATAADLVETAFFTNTIPGGTFNTDGQGFRMTAFISTGATANSKTVTAYVGTTSISGSTLANNQAIFLEIVGTYIAATGRIIWTFEMRTPTDGIKRASFTTSSDDWTLSQVIKITGTNGIAAAGDLNFRTGRLDFLGVPVAAMV